MSIQQRFPSVSYLREKAQKRLPKFAWAYLDGATGREQAKQRNGSELSEMVIVPRVLKGALEPDPSITFLGEHWSLPFGMSPVGLSGLIWPNAERILAVEAQRHKMVYCLSTYASQPPEVIGPILAGRGWFQFNTPESEEICRDIVQRVTDSGFPTLVLSLDTPAPSRRERQIRSGFPSDGKLTLQCALQASMRPAWAIGMLRQGKPQLRLFDRYKASGDAGPLPMRNPDRGFLDTIRRLWPGKLLVKGIMHAEDARILWDCGVDALWISNHGGRQFDGAPSSVSALRSIRAALGPTVPLVFDGGVSSGLDVLKAYGAGADLVMMGRTWHYGLAALGARGAAHVRELLAADILSNMAQMGVRNIAELKALATV